MQLQTFDIFTINADAYYTSLEPAVNTDIANIKDILLTDAALEDKTIAIFEKHYIFNEFEIQDVDKGIIIKDLDDKIAASLIGNSFIATGLTNGITEIWYDLEVKSGLLSVHQTVQYPQQSVKGALKGSLMRLQFNFQQSDATLIGPIALQEKERIIALIKANNDDLKMYFESRKVLFQAQIKLKIQDQVAQNKQQEEERNHF